MAKTEVHGGAFEPQMDAKIAEIEVNKDEVDMKRAKEPQAEEGEKGLDPIQVQQGRREDLEYMSRHCRSSSLVLGKGPIGQKKDDVGNELDVGWRRETSSRDEKDPRTTGSRRGHR